MRKLICVWFIEYKSLAMIHHIEIQSEFQSEFQSYLLVKQAKSQYEFYIYEYARVYYYI